MIDYLKVLDKPEIEKCKNIIHSLKEHYTKFPDNYFLNTLGAATYQHCEEKEFGKYYDKDLYYLIKNKSNPILMKNFNWLYDIIINKIETLTNEKCVISDAADLAYPGFHILYAHKNSENVTEAIHLDVQWKPHIDHLNKIFKKVELNNFITYTLCIELPEGGGGLYYWPLRYDKDYDYEESKEEYMDLIELSNKIAPFNTDDSFDGCERKIYEEQMRPNILMYKEGYMTFFRRFILHQVMPFIPPFSIGDKRITLQGHAIKCDDIWRLYF